MPIVRRNLTVHFQKSVKVTSSASIPQSVEVTVIPLSDASNADLVATYVGGPQTQTSTLLDDDNIVSFALVPSNFPGLSNPINYRIMWRVGGVTGRTETYDFAMPDVDISFDQLVSTGSIIDGSAYLQQSDLGVAGRVARLNGSGKVVDAQGQPVATLGDVAEVQDNLEAAVAIIEDAAESQQSLLLQNLDYEINILNTALTGTIQQAITGWNNNLREERNSRVAAISSINSTLGSLSSTVTSSSASFSSSIQSINNSLIVKADLVNGRIPLAQIPPEAITNWIPLTAASQRFNLNYPNDIQLGDIVLTPTGLYGLIGDNPSQPSSWYLLNQIQSVNGKLGNVVLSAQDVGAIPANATIPQSQIDNLSNTIAGLTPTATSNSLQNQINAIKNDSKIVKLNASNQINSIFLDANVAYLNVLGQIVKKDGTVISDPAELGVTSINGRRGVVTLTATDVGAISSSSSIPQSQVSGLVAGLANKADLSSGKVSISQIPFLPQSQVTGLSDALSARASLVGGTVPLAQIPAIPQSGVTGLSSVVSGNQLTSSSNAVNRITSLEGRVTSLEVNGTGGGGGTATITTSVSWGGTSSDDIVENFSTVTLASPFGIYSSGPNQGKWYYNKNGVPSGDAAFPTVTPNGHLRLYKWNEDNGPDIVYATTAEVAALSATVATLGQSNALKANQADLVTQTERINTLFVAKAELDSITNTLVNSQIPFLAKENPKVVASTNEMRQLTTSQVHAGDLCIVAGIGTYTLMGNNPSQINNTDGWALHPVPSSGSGGSGTVVSLSGPSQVKIFPDSTGNIPLSANDIGAASVSSLSNYVTSTDFTTQISGKTSISDVYTAIGTSQLVRGRVDYAVRSFQIGATTYCANGVPITANAPSGSPIIDRDIDGNLIYAQNNSLVLLTNQSDPRYNGVWRVNTGGAWSRPTGSDPAINYAVGSRVFSGTIVMVNNSSSIGGLGQRSGTTNYTLWQNISNATVDSTSSGVSASTNWRNLGSIAPIAITGSNGVVISGTYPNIRIGSDVEGGFVRKYNVTVSPNSVNYTVTHGLNTMYPQVTVIDDVSQSAVLVGWKVGSPVNGRYDSIILEFNPQTFNNSYRISVQG